MIELHVYPRASSVKAEEVISASEFQDLISRLSKPPIQAEDKRSSPLSSRAKPGTPLPGKKRPSTAASWPQLVIPDFDGTDVGAAQASELLSMAGIPHFVHTTWSYGEDPGPWRLRIWTSILAHGPESLRTWCQRIGRVIGAEPDPTCWEPGRHVFLPSVHPGRSGTHESASEAGEWIHALEPEASDRPVEIEEPARWEGDFDEVVEAAWAIPASLQEGPGGRDHWLRIGMCFHHSSHERAEEEWDRWSRRVENYSAEDQRTAWASFRHTGRRTPRTIFRLADQHSLGWRRPPRLLAETAFADEAAAGLILDVAEARQVTAADWIQLGRPGRIQLGRGGQVLGTLENAIRLIGVLDLGLQYDELADREVMTGTGLVRLERTFPSIGWQVDDHALTAIRVQLTRSREHPVELSKDQVAEAVTALALNQRISPVADWLRGLRWDGMPRIDTWLQRACGVPDRPYERDVGRLMLWGLAARALSPGVKQDCLVVLEGPQGIGKSTLLKILAGGDEYYLDGIPSGDLSDKDVVASIIGKWVVELTELEVARKADAESLKAFLSRTHDRARLSYKRKAKDYPRRCGFVGTTNKEDYLKDDTGNRRFLPVRCGRVDLALARTEREQLLAEAAIAWQEDPRHERLFLREDLWGEAASEQSQREVEEPWTESVIRWLDGDGRDVQSVTGRDVLESAVLKASSGQTPGDLKRVGAIMRRLGWSRKPVRIGGYLVKSYVRPTRPTGK